MFQRGDQAFGTVVISSHGEEDKKSRQSTTHRIRERLRKKQNQAPKWNYCCNEASCTLLTDIWRNTPCKSGYRRRCSRRFGKDCSMLRSPIVHSTKAMIPGYNQAPKWNYCCNEASCTLLSDIWRNAPCKSGYRRRCSRRSGKEFFPHRDNHSQLLPYHNPNCRNPARRCEDTILQDDDDEEEETDGSTSAIPARWCEDTILQDDDDEEEGTDGSTSAISIFV